jgi:pyruvate formate lyase activating enzyme
MIDGVELARHPAVLGHPLADNWVRCDLCAHRCRIPPGSHGICAVRANHDGSLYSLVYGRAITAHVDPMEKKPLYHFLPGSTIFSIATAGCNFHCDFCQNWDISQAGKGSGSKLRGEAFPPDQIVAAARRTGCRSIAYTYNEPTVFFEYAYDTAVLAHGAGLKNVFVTNGYQTPEAIALMRGVIDAANIDLKAFRDATYRRLCGARLQPVLDAIKLMHEAGIWVEVTTLVVPGENDSPAELRDIAHFIAGVSADMPWHISRFHPDYRMTNTGPTPRDTLLSAAEIGRAEGLHYVYIGNLPGSGNEDTRCPSCGQTVVQRSGYSVRSNLRGHRCPQCNSELPFVTG